MRTYTSKEREFNRKIGEKVKEYRTQNNVSQQKLANELDISISTYIRKERGESFFTAYEIAFVADYLKTRLDNFFPRI